LSTADLIGRPKLQAVDSRLESGTRGPVKPDEE